MMNISLILPAYNEEHNLEYAVHTAVKNFKDLFQNYEIIVIDDHSQDETQNVAKRLQKQYGQEVISIYQNEKNLGQGASLYKGFHLAQYEWVMHNGVDCPFEFSDLPDCLKNLDNEELIVIERKNRKAYNLWRKLVSKTFVQLINFVGKNHFDDYSFIQIFKKDLIHQHLDPNFKSTAFLMPSFILNCHHGGRKIKRIKKLYHKRGSGKATGSSFGNIIKGFKDLASYKAQAQKKQEL